MNRQSSTFLAYASGYERFYLPPFVPEFENRLRPVRNSTEQDDSHVRIVSKCFVCCITSACGSKCFVVCIRRTALCAGLPTPHTPDRSTPLLGGWRANRPGSMARIPAAVWWRLSGLCSLGKLTSQMTVTRYWTAGCQSLQWTCAH